MERIKTFLLIGLFISAIVLSGFVFVDIQEVQAILFVNQTEDNAKNVNISDFFTPQSFQVSFGGGLYSVLYEPTDVYPFWHKYSKLLKNYLHDEQAQINEINTEQRNNIGLKESAKVVFPFTMDLQQLQIMLGEDINLISSITFDQIVLMTEGDNPVYFINSKDKVAYQLIAKGQDHTSFIETFDNLFANDQNITQEVGIIDYKRMEEIFNLRQSLNEVDNENFVENPVLFPEEVVTNIASIELTENKSPVEISQSEMFKTIKDDIFGQQSNFVKTVRDDLGSIIYIYGYNEKALKIDANGNITYQEHITADTDKTSTEYKSIIVKALSLVAKYDLLPNSNSLYISDYVNDEMDGLIHQVVSFDYKIKGIPVMVDANGTNHAIEIEFINGNISKFEINYRNSVNPNDLSKAFYPRPLYDVLVKSDTIVKMRNEFGKDKEDEFFNTLQNINGIQLVYYPLPTESGYTLFPVWELSIDDKKYLFDFLGIPSLQENIGG